MAELGTLDTFPKLLMHHAARARRPAGDPREGPRHLADLDLAALRRRGARARLRPAAEGLRRGEPPRAGRRQPAAAVRGDVRGAVPGRHPGAALPGRGRRRRWRSRSRTPRSRFAFAEDQEQVDKLLEILPQCPTLKRIYYDDPRGLRHYTQPRAAQLRRACSSSARGSLARDPAFFEAEIAKGTRQPTSPAMFFTSGTTGAPKGVVLTHASLHRPGAHRGRDGGLGERRRDPRLPAAGVDRAEHLFLRAGRSSPATASAAPSRPRR